MCQKILGSLANKHAAYICTHRNTHAHIHTDACMHLYTVIMPDTSRCAQDFHVIHPMLPMQSPWCAPFKAYYRNVFSAIVTLEGKLYIYTELCKLALNTSGNNTSSTHANKLRLNNLCLNQYKRKERQVFSYRVFQ